MPSTQPLRLGELGGNMFHIVLRDVDASNDLVDATMASLRDHGRNLKICLFWKR